MRQARQPTAIRTRQAETYGYDARADFEAAWKVFLPNRTEADFQAWRDQEAWTAENIAGLIGANACRTIGGRVPERGWQRSFDDPILLPRGGY